MENYKEQFKRLDKALKAGFNLEAIFIEYAIMEDRTSFIEAHFGNIITFLCRGQMEFICGQHVFYKVCRS